MTKRNALRARSRGLRGTLAAGLLGLVAAACASPPPPEPTGFTDDFDAPRPKLVASLLGAAAHREARGDLDGALHTAEQAHAAAPRSGAAALREAELRAAVANRAGDEAGLAEARSDVGEIVEQYPDAPAPRLARARIALASGDRESARAEAQKLVDEKPDWAAPHALLSRTMLDDDPARALALAKRAVDLAQSDPDALAARAFAHSALGWDNAASEDARRALLLRASPDLVGVVARGRLRNGDPRGAARRIEAVIEAERDVALEILLARAKIALGDLDAARGALVRAKTLAGDDAEAQVDAIAASLDLALAEKRPGDALAEISAARKLGPDDARLAELAARAEIELGRLPDAEADARRSIELRPERQSAWAMLALAITRAEASPPWFARARAALPGSEARAHALAGVIADQKADAATAQTEYEAALAGEPGLAVAEVGLAFRLARIDPPRALALAESARAKMGWTVTTAQTLGIALLANGRATDAVDALRIAVARIEPGAPESGPVQNDLAHALDAAGETKEARTLASGLVAAGRGIEPAPPWLLNARALKEKLAPAKAGAEASVEAPAPVVTPAPASGAPPTSAPPAPPAPSVEAPAPPKTSAPTPTP
jgi:tetratricopeptide (TPR) repeat protein